MSKKAANQRTQATKQQAAAKAAAQRTVQKAKAGPAPAKNGFKPTGNTAGPQPAAAQTLAPPISPFLNADDLTALANFNADFATKLGDIDKSLGDLGADTSYQKTQTDTTAKENTAGTQDAMIARGLFQSSVKDAALYDIEAQRTLQQGYLDDRLTRATLDAGTQKKALGDWKTAFDTAQNVKAVQNAQAIPPNTATTPTPNAWSAPKPKAAAPVAVSQSAQPTTKSSPKDAAQAYARNQRANQKQETQRAKALRGAR